MHTPEGEKTKQDKMMEGNGTVRDVADHEAIGAMQLGGTIP